jgi:septal ring factor EnvC (AmiA/AmiB activator)
MSDDELKLTIDEKRVIAEGFVAAAKDLVSHKAALDKLTENQDAQQKTLTELAATANENFKRLEELVNEQNKAVMALRDLVLPPGVN